ncbi:hypothetical protein ABZ202_16245 [Streptomyces sp. NPDC006186]|jgi:hypothetical protein|uniref:hypothetical protein n=1 Tax=Streptomyces sp. NPDC006186 TaxID=3155248 RepID=UPI0033A52FC8
MVKRLEAGWWQRLAWVALSWVSLGFLMWVPFLYIGIRRNRASDWFAFGSFVLYEIVSMSWTEILPNQTNRAGLGLIVILTLITATLMLLFGEFDKKTPRQPAYAPAHPAPHPRPYGYPYGR